MAIDVLLKKHQPLPREEADRLGRDVNFLVDCLYAAEPDVKQAAIDRLGKVAGHAVDLKVDPSAPPEAWSAAVEKVRGEVAAGPASQPTTAPAGK